MSIKISAGLAIIHRNKVLLVHPTNAKWKGTFSIPKGLVDQENDASLIAAAIRETKEETGLDILEDWIDPTPHVIEYRKEQNDKHSRVYKKLHWFVADVSDKPITDFVVDQDQLQLEEVDYVGFFNYQDAVKRIFWRQVPILMLIR